jgi:hypothetical protein
MTTLWSWCPELHRVEYIDKEYTVHEEWIKATPEWSTGSMKFLTIIFRSWEVNLAGMA